ncbi:MAG: UDP-N-acetylmuramoyl-L-alanyl-D-glutamate--2,6-diaminopimelate ligase, partial [Candidatus Omnitrophota bacterium]
MIKKKAKSLLKGLGISVEPVLGALKIRSVAIDSKMVKKGDLFIALRGTACNGHDFIEEAIKNGASLILADEKKHMKERAKNIIKVDNTQDALEILIKNFYCSPWKNMKMFGITGTNGKTTVSYLVENILNSARLRCGVIGTIKYKIGKNVIQATRTTPGVLELNDLLNKMKNAHLKAVSMEVSSHALDQERIRGILFDAAIFTNLTHEHLDYHGSLKKYLACKMKIFSHLKKKGIAVLNVDDRHAAFMKRSIRGKCITYGIKNCADVTAQILEENVEGSRFAVHIYKKHPFIIETKLPGRHNILNILAAIAACFGVGIKLEAIKRGIEATKHIEGRLEPVRKKADFKVFIDYAHTHNALENVLKFLTHIKRGKIITVFGCGGDRDKKKRPI